MGYFQLKNNLIKYVYSVTELSVPEGSLLFAKKEGKVNLWYS